MRQHVHTNYASVPCNLHICMRRVPPRACARRHLNCDYAGEKSLRPGSGDDLERGLAHALGSLLGQRVAAALDDLEGGAGDRAEDEVGLGAVDLVELAGHDGRGAGDDVEVDFDTGVITDNTTGKTYQAEPFPPFIQGIIKDGGLINHVTK